MADTIAPSKLEPIHNHEENSLISDVKLDPKTTRIQAKNRRQMYLSRHPSYFTSPDLELADPLLYDTCIRRFQSASEREADGRAKGYSGVLEADLYRSEAKLAALTRPSPQHQSENPARSQPNRTETTTNTTRPSSSSTSASNSNPNPYQIPTLPLEQPQSREEGSALWQEVMGLRFMRGEDEDFEHYAEVDADEGLDEVAWREEEERWFEDESPAWVGEEGEGENDVDVKGGETGIQDF